MNIPRFFLHIAFYGVLLLLAQPLFAANWPGWRGDGSGISPEKNLPIAWTTTDNVRWKVAVPGEGNSSPVVWGDRVFLTASAQGGKQRSVLCFDAKDGRMLWQRTLAAERAPVTDMKNGYASPTPVTDGTHVYAFFDSPGVVALDWDGNVLWTRDFGPFKNVYNMAASPVLYGDLVIMVCDQDSGGFIVALEKATGNEKWRTPRPLSAHYATPLVITAGGTDQVVVSGGTICAYDPNTGKELWRCKGLAPTVTPSPVAANGLVYATSGRNGPTLAIDPAGRGDVTETRVRMRATTGGPYVPSPLVYPYMILPGDNGALRVLTPSGQPLLDFRAPGHYTTSPVAGDGKIYWPTEKGDVYVLDATGLSAKTPSLKVLAVNALGEKCLASPAISGERLYFRTEKSLFCIAGQGQVQAVAAGGPTATFEELEKRFAEHPAALGPDVDVRIEVVEALGQSPDQRAIPLLRNAALNDAHWDVSEAAVKSLAQLGIPAIQALVTVLGTSGDWQPYLKIISAQALARLRSIEAVPTLLKGAENRDPLVRAECIRALGSIAAISPEQLSAALPIFIGAVRNPESAVREAAANALSLQTGAAGSLRQTIVNALLDGAADRNPLVVEAARQGIEAMKVSDAAIMRDILLYGEQRKTPFAAELKAGPIRLKFQDGELRYLHVGNKEIIRRIYFAVRDSRWDTVMPDIHICDIQQGEDGFTIKLTATCWNDIADYKWSGIITGTAEGKITFTVTGQANADFKSPRIGICILYGTESLAGQRYELLDDKGAVIAGEFPAKVTNDLLAKLDSFRTLRYTTAEGMTVSVGLRDQNFGMEDQRNYGDTSYKAMSGMAYEFPNVVKGKSGNQVCTVQVTNHVATAAAPVAPLGITLGKPVAGAKLPRLALPAAEPTKNTFMTYNGDPRQFANVSPIVLSYCPALHLPDDDTYLENIPTVVDWVRTLRAALPGAKFRVDPVTMNSPYPRAAEDARNRGLFGAAWSVRMLKYLALAGVEEAAFAFPPGYAKVIQQRIGAYAGARLLAVSVPSGILPPIDALAIEAKGKRVIWVANLTDKKTSVSLANLAPAKTARLAVMSTSQPAFSTAAFTQKSVPVKNGELEITLDPFAVVEVSVDLAK